jgi:hypothetical protein
MAAMAAIALAAIAAGNNGGNSSGSGSSGFSLQQQKTMVAIVMGGSQTTSTKSGQQ